MNVNVGFGATINGKHTWKDYRLVVSNTDVVGMPKPKTLIIDIPGSSKRLDLSEALTGRCEYESRTLIFTLGGIGPIENWAARLTAFVNEIHGRRVQVVLDQEPDYYFEGRAEVKGFDRIRALGKIELEIVCDAYKWEVVSSSADWLWDPFNFETGIIREYKNLKVNNTLVLTIPGSRIPVVPTFILSNVQAGTSSPYVYVDEYRKRWNLSTGKNRFAELSIPPEGLRLTLSGTFTLTIDMKGGSL